MAFDFIAPFCECMHYVMNLNFQCSAAIHCHPEKSIAQHPDWVHSQPHHWIDGKQWSCVLLPFLPIKRLQSNWSYIIKYTLNQASTLLEMLSFSVNNNMNISCMMVDRTKSDGMNQNVEFEISGFECHSYRPYIHLQVAYIHQPNYWPQMSNAKIQRRNLILESIHRSTHRFWKPFRTNKR